MANVKMFFVELLRGVLKLLLVAVICAVIGFGIGYVLGSALFGAILGGLLGICVPLAKANTSRTSRASHSVTPGYGHDAAIGSGGMFIAGGGDGGCGGDGGGC